MRWKKLNRERKVGTMTTGLALVAFGILFLLRSVIPGLDYELILSLWPLILISMGIELISYHIFAEELQLRLDGGAVCLLFMLGVFSFAMAGFESAIKYINLFV